GRQLLDDLARRGSVNVAWTALPEVEPQRVSSVVDRSQCFVERSDAANFDSHSTHRRLPESDAATSGCVSAINLASAFPGCSARMKCSPTRNASNPTDFSIRMSAPPAMPLSATNEARPRARDARFIEVDRSTLKVVRSRLFIPMILAPA